MSSSLPSRGASATDSEKETPMATSGEASFPEVQENIRAEKKAA
jgi:hypothetical protein